MAYYGGPEQSRPDYSSDASSFSINSHSQPKPPGQVSRSNNFDKDMMPYSKPKPVYKSQEKDQSSASIYSQPPPMKNDSQTIPQQGFQINSHQNRRPQNHPQQQSNGWSNQQSNGWSNQQSNGWSNQQGQDYTAVGNMYKNPGQRGRGNFRGNFGNSFDNKGRANTGFRENFRGRGRGRGRNQMPISRGGHHRNLNRSEGEADNDEDDLFRPAINEKRQAFMDRKKTGTKEAAKAALDKVKARKLMWRSQRKEIAQKEEADRILDEENAAAKAILEEKLKEQLVNGPSNDSNNKGDESDKKEETESNNPAFYVKKASLNPFGGNVGEKFAYKHDKDLEFKILAEEEKKDAITLADKTNKKNVLKFGMHCRNPGVKAPQFRLNDSHVSKNTVNLTSKGILPQKRQANFTENTYVGITPYKSKEAIEIAQKSREVRLRKDYDIRDYDIKEDNPRVCDPRETMVYNDPSKSQNTPTKVNTAIPQPKIIDSTSDYYNQAVSSLSGDDARKAKFQRLMGLNKKRNEGQEPKNTLRRTYDPSLVNQELENQFNSLRGGKFNFSN